jgi:hypothetical protein
VVDLASQTEVGSTANTYAIDFGRENGNFDVICRYGTLTVTEPTNLPTEPEEPAEPDAPTFTPVYEYVCDADIVDPSILGEPPVSEASYATGQEFALAMPSETHVIDAASGGVWDFAGWTLDGVACDPVAVMGDEAPVFIGMWVFTEATPVVTIESWTYDATDASGKIDADSGYGDEAGEAEYVYERKTVDWARGDGWEGMDAAPVHAGTYRATAYWTLAGGSEVSAASEFTISPAVLELTSGSLSKEYDGEALEHPDVAITAGRLYGSDSFSTLDFASITEPGVTDNTFAVDLGDAAGDYLVRKNYGTLEVTEAVKTPVPGDGGDSSEDVVEEVREPVAGAAAQEPVLEVESDSDATAGKYKVLAVVRTLPGTGDATSAAALLATGFLGIVAAVFGMVCRRTR